MGALVLWAHEGERRTKRGRLFNGLTVGYLFLGGTGGGTLVVLCVLLLVDCLRRFSFNSHFSRQYGAMAWSACLLLLGLGVLCLLADMGNPSRALGFLFTREVTVTTWGSWGLLAAMLICGVFWLAFAFDNVNLPEAVAFPLAVAGVLAGLLVAIYTGVLLQTMVSVLAWGTPLVPALFCVSSVSCGIAVALAFVGLTPTRLHMMEAVEMLLRIDGWVIVGEAVLMALYLGWLFLRPETVHFGQHLLSGEGSVFFWLIFVGGGLVLPLILERSVTYANHRTQLLFVALCVLVGGFALRAWMVGLFPLDITQTTNIVSSSIGVGI